MLAVFDVDFMITIQVSRRIKASVYEFAAQSNFPKANVIIYKNIWVELTQQFQLLYKKCI